MKYTKVQEISSVLSKSINEENIEILVRSFYSQVLQDTLLAPFFIEKLGDNLQNEKWEEHLQLLTEFWKFVALGYEEYTGNPLQPHLHIQGLSREAFSQWLKLFHQTVDQTYVPSAGKYFKQKSTDIAENFIRKLSL